MKLSAKFARRETEAARRARIGRRRIPRERLAAIRRLLDLAEPQTTDPARRPDGDRGGT